MPLCPVDPTCRLYYEIVTTRLPLVPLDTPFPAAPSESPNSPWTGKPKLLIIVPLTFDISASCMRELLSNDELLEKFDLVALEPRGHGRTECDPTPSQDAWTAAGDLIVFMDELGLPAAHIMSGHNVSSDAVLRMATIAPEMVLSMTLCGISRQVDSAFFNYAINEIVLALGHSSSLEEWYEAIILAGQILFNFGYSNDQLLQDEYGGIFIRRYNPHQAVKVFVSMGYWVGRPKIPEKLLAQVRTRTIIIQGEEDVPYGPEAGHELEGLLLNAKDLKYVKIPGAPTCIAVTSMHEILTHILSIPTAPAPSPLPAFDVRTALHRLQNVASLTPGSESVKNIAFRPLQSGSFSIMPEAKIAEVAVELKRMVETEPIFKVPGMDDPELWTGKTWDECHTHLWRNRYL